MFIQNDEQYILRNLGRHNIVLFLGAGFSSEGTNIYGNPLPIGAELAQQLWDFMDFGEAYDGSSLQDVYQAFLESTKKKVDKEEFLNNTLLVDTYPEEYLSILDIYWNRIYTTNVDDLIDDIFRKKKDIKLRSISYPFDDPIDVDQSLEFQQVIYLHGKLPCELDDLIFSTMQYAASVSIHQPLYDCFLRDYFTKPTIFIGTSLNEQLFWQYLEARQGRSRNIGEKRAKSFVIAPTISKAKSIILKKYNIVPITATTLDFLDWIEEKSNLIPNKNDILKVTFPSLVHIINSKSSKSYKNVLIEFSKSFHHITLKDRDPNYKSSYLLGAAPKWEDLFNNLDAPRRITSTIFNEVDKVFKNPNSNLRVIGILGSAGSGKSTILKRLGIQLTQAGRRVFLTNSEFIPKTDVITETLKIIEDKTALLFDNSEVTLGIIPKITKALENQKHPPIIIFAARTSDFGRVSGRFDPTVDFKDFYVPHLERSEIIELIGILEDNNLPGKLRGMTPAQQIHEFEIRSRKQILVAMREATSGKGFDEIILDEFKRITPKEAKLLGLCTALATDAGFRITKQEFVACGKEPIANILYYLGTNLRDIVVTSGSNDELLMIRHRRIAEHYVNKCASQELLKEAYLRILKSLATDILGKKWYTRQFKLYRNLINHRTILLRFGKRIANAREIYDELADYFSDDYHYWLQYGSLETEGGRLDFAENYLNQSESLNSQDYYVQTAKSNLYLKKGVNSEQFESAVQYRDQGNQLLIELIQNYGGDDAHCYHIYCHQNLNWINNWITDKTEKKKELEELIKVTKEAILSHPFNKWLESFEKSLERTYLNLVL